MMSTVSIIRCISLTKIINLIKILSSYLLSTLFRKNIVWGLPSVFNIEPTNYCNLSCPHCPTGAKKITRNKGHMEISYFKSIIKKIKKQVFIIQLYFQGEPFLNKNLIEFIRIIKANDIFLIIRTNGHFFEDKNFVDNLVKAKPDLIIISLDGATEQTYKIYRQNGDFKKVITGIKNLVLIKNLNNYKLPKIILQFLIMKHNEHEIEAIKKLADELKVDKLELKTAQFYNWNNPVDFLPKNEKYRQYENQNGKIKLNTKYKRNCLRAWTTSLITWDGKVVPCCFDKNADYSYGTLSEDIDIKDIWKSKPANIFRKNILRKRDKIKICQNCTTGVKI